MLLTMTKKVSNDSPRLVKKTSNLLTALRKLGLTGVKKLFVLGFVKKCLICTSVFTTVNTTVGKRRSSRRFVVPVVLLLVFTLCTNVCDSSGPSKPLTV